MKRPYRKVYSSIWNGRTGSLIRRVGPDAFGVAHYLVDSPQSYMGGLYRLSVDAMAFEMGFTEVERARQILQFLVDIGFAEYDAACEFVFVREMAHYQVGEALKPKDNRRIAMQRMVDRCPSEPLRRSFLSRYGDLYGLQPPSNPLRTPLQPPSKGVPNPLPTPLPPPSKPEEQIFKPLDAAASTAVCSVSHVSPDLKTQAQRAGAHTGARVMGEGEEGEPEEPEPKAPRPLPPDALRFADFLRGQILAAKPDHRLSKTPWGQDAAKRRKWAEELDRMQRIDGRSWRRSAELVRWVAEGCPGVEFEFVVESPRALRAKWDRLDAAYGKRKGAASTAKFSAISAQAGRRLRVVSDDEDKNA